MNTTPITIQVQVSFDVNRRFLILRYFELPPYLNLELYQRGPKDDESKFMLGHRLAFLWVPFKGLSFSLVWYVALHTES